MSTTQKKLEVTALRSLEMHSRLLTLDQQMMECITLLQSPDVALTDLSRSIEMVSKEGLDDHPFALDSVPSDSREGFFYPCRELFVQGDGGSFTCLATGVEYRDEDADAASGTAQGANARPIDYASVTCESTPFPVLGFVQSAESESAYPLLLRAFSSLIELARPGRLDALDAEIYRGLLGSPPLFDLAIVLWDDDREDDPRRPLCELSRDLAETLKRALVEDPGFPPVLRDVVCLRMNPKRFDARLRYVWRI